MFVKLEIELLDRYIILMAQCKFFLQFFVIMELWKFVL